MDVDQHGSSYVAQSSPLPPASSSPRGPLSPVRSRRRKERRPPSVTPKRFGRFFTPRSSQPLAGRRILASVASEELNRQPFSPDSHASDLLSSDPIVPSPSRNPASPARNGRKRASPGGSEPIVHRRGLTFDDMPPPHLDLWGAQTLPASIPEEACQDSLGDWRKATLNRFFRTSRGQDQAPKERLIRDALRGPATKRQRRQSPERHAPTPVRKLANRGFEVQLLDREHGFASQPGRHHLTYPACDPRMQTADFYSNSSDHEYTASYEGGGNTTPFCQASYHNSLVTVIGDEQGYLRHLRTDGWSDGSGKVEASFKAHDNAVIDVDVSADDMRLATACGDWSGTVFDVTTQSAAVDLKGHVSGMRQVLFQPGRANGDVLATAAKDGCINIWDLRCSSLPVNTFSSLLGYEHRATRRNPNLGVMESRPINSMDLAHVRTANGSHSPASITTLQWFPSGREHLLVSGSESSAAIKLWDMRCIKPRHRDQATPLAVTAEPRHHTFRSYGLTSLALNGDASRLYSVCKDNTIYAYSTAHLILGQAPELVNSAVKRKPRAVQGIGPLYGWKNERLSGISFWVKTSIRPARGCQPEMLAVGGNDKCPILFPTDERYMRTAFAQRNHILEPMGPSTGVSSVSASRSTPSSLTPSAASIPIFKCGTPLVGGHDKEVSTVGWTSEGRLVSLSDDGSVRHWQTDDRERARYLRQVGDFGGERWNAGWAEVGDDWDEDEDE